MSFYPTHLGSQAKIFAEILASSETNCTTLEQQVRNYLRSNPWRCTVHCVALDLGPLPGERHDVAIVSGTDYVRVALPQPADVTPAHPALPRIPVGPESKVEVKTLERRYIVVDGFPLGAPLDETSIPLEGPAPPR